MTLATTFFCEGQHPHNAAPQGISATLSAPTRFYKYRSVTGESKQWTESILLRNELFFAARNQFNDPFDCRPRFTTEATVAEKHRFLKGALRYARYVPKDRTSRASLAKSLSKEDTLLSEVMKEVINDLEAHFYHRVGILCLSTKPDDILMWSHYADSHRGVCLAFIGEKGTCPLPTARPVHYQKDLPVCNPMLVTSEEMKRLMMYTKANHWSYEQEWRMTSADGPGAKRFPAPLLKEVILGAMISPESETVVRKWLASRFHRVKLRRAILRTDGYGITVVNA